MERNANYLPTVRSENSPPRSESNRSAIKKWPNVMGNMGLIAFQTCLFVFLNASSYGFDVHAQSTVSFYSGCGWIIGLFLYGWALKGVGGKVAHCIPVALLVGIFVSALLLQAVGLMDLAGWIRLLLSVALQGASLFCGWWAAEQLSNPHGGVCENI